MKAESKQEYFISDKALSIVVDRIDTRGEFIALYRGNHFISHIDKQYFDLVFQRVIDGTIYLEIKEVI